MTFLWYKPHAEKHVIEDLSIMNLLEDEENGLLKTSVVRSEMLHLIISFNRNKGRITARDYLLSLPTPFGAHKFVDLNEAAYRYCTENNLEFKAVEVLEIGWILFFPREVLDHCIQEFAYLMNRGNVFYSSFKVKPPRKIVADFKKYIEKYEDE